MQHFGKLVRDKIPEINAWQGETPNVYTLDEGAYRMELDRKLSEEIAEYQKDKSLEELADVMEVIHAICAVRGYTLEDLHAAQRKKRETRGGFEKRIYLVSKE